MNSPIKCWHCTGTIESTDAYCKFCGKGQGQTIPFRYSHAGIIVFSLLLGPIALPIIWKSPKIGNRSKAAYVIGNLVITWLVLSSVFGMYSRMNNQVQEMLKIVDPTGMGALK